MTKITEDMIPDNVGGYPVREFWISDNGFTALIVVGSHDQAENYVADEGRTDRLYYVSGYPYTAKGGREHADFVKAWCAINCPEQIAGTRVKLSGQIGGFQ